MKQVTRSKFSGGLSEIFLILIIKLQLISLSGASEDSILEGRSSFKTVMVPDILMLLETLEREQIEIDVEEVAGRKFNLFYGN